MIESIYSKDQEEIIKTQVNPMYRFPKNLRQIGQTESKKKIYVEDYVITYIKQISRKDIENYQFAVLLGKVVRLEESNNIFISGAVHVKEISIEENTVFTDEVWSSIYGDIKKYFIEVEIVGWVLTKPGLELEIDEKLKKIHLDNFAGQDKILLMYDSQENEEEFFAYVEGALKRQRGYYIYYEKNEEMQNYMIEQKEMVSEESEYEDTAMKEIRNIIASKKEIPGEKKIVHFIYAASTVLAASILIVGATMLKNYDKINNLENTINTISQNIDRQTIEQIVEETNIPKDEVTEVETMSGNLSTIKQEKIHGEDEQASKIQSKSDYYIVKKGDTLASISTKLYKSVYYVPQIKQLNKLEDEDKIYAGQKLILPKKKK